jgi:hypothetical protein
MFRNFHRRIASAYYAIYNGAIKRAKVGMRHTVCKEAIERIEFDMDMLFVRVESTYLSLICGIFSVSAESKESRLAWKASLLMWESRESTLACEIISLMGNRKRLEISPQFVHFLLTLRDRLLYPIDVDLDFVDCCTRTIDQIQQAPTAFRNQFLLGLQCVEWLIQKVAAILQTEVK